MHKAIIGTLFAILLCPVVATRASAAPDTYSGEAPVASQSDADRDAALQKALVDVITDVSGDAAAATRPDVVKAAAAASRLVLQYQYKSEPDTATGAAGLRLVAEFDRNGVDALIARLGLASGSTATTPSATPSQVTVSIGGIGSAEDYARVIGYLAHDNFVTAVDPVAADGDRLQVKLALATGLPEFLNAIGLEGTLAIDASRPLTPGVDAMLALQH